VPLDLVKTEQHRITQELGQAETLLKQVQVRFDLVELRLTAGARRGRREASSVQGAGTWSRGSWNEKWP
jgi:hypothetical protein